jgi:hypothetical protein
MWRTIWKDTLVLSKAKYLTLIILNLMGCMRSMQKKFGTLGTISTFACRQKKIKEICIGIVLSKGFANSR